MLSVFNEMSSLMATIGVILGIAMGFDLVTREKESKSLKILLSHPVYRDEVINGKALGGIAAIALAMGVVLVISLAVMLLFGIVPNFEETVRMFLFGALSFLLVFSFFRSPCSCPRSQRTGGPRSSTRSSSRSSSPSRPEIYLSR